MERFLPRRWRVPLRYYVQWLIGSLEPEMSLLPALIAKNKIAVDVGANVGTYSLPLSHLCKQVVAFEPVPVCASVLAAWSQGRNVIVHPCGLAESSGQLTMAIPYVDAMLVTTRATFVRGAPEAQTLRVPVAMLDDFALQDVGFIKIDVEGFELSVLRGAEATIHRCRPNLLIEIDPLMQSEQQFAGTFDWLTERGYQGHYLDHERLIPCDKDVQRRQPHLMNFVFLPEGVVCADDASLT